MTTHQRNAHQAAGPTGIRPVVWLLVLGSALVVFVAICLRRPVASNSAQETANKLSETPGPGAVGADRRGGRDDQRRGASVAAEPRRQGKTLDDLVSDLESTDYEVVKAARQALADLGAEAGPAIPRLAEMLKTDRTCNRAAYALATIGTSSLPVLRDALTNGSAAARLEVALAIGTLREAAEDAVPGLVECMKYDDPEVRLNAIASLQMIAKGPVIAVPGLIGCLADSDARVRRSATIVLEKYGQVEADTTIPMLLRTAGQGENPLVRMRAAEILRAIAPERARAEGL